MSGRSSFSRDCTDSCGQVGNQDSQCCDSSICSSFGIFHLNYFAAQLVQEWSWLCWAIWGAYPLPSWGIIFPLKFWSLWPRFSSYLRFSAVRKCSCKIRRGFYGCPFFLESPFFPVTSGHKCLSLVSNVKYFCKSNIIWLVGLRVCTLEHLLVGYDLFFQCPTSLRVSFSPAGDPHKALCATPVSLSSVWGI